MISEPLADQVVAQQIHQASDLLAGTGPVLDEKAYSVSASIPSSRLARVTSRTLSAPTRWPSIRGLPALLRPAAVAIHDDADVARQLGGGHIDGIWVAIRFEGRE
jgi:hypothetical protein